MSRANDMSLKAFHVFFIAVSILLCGGFGWWCFTAEEARGRLGYTVLGIATLVIGLGLIVYEINFLRKFKNTE